jgi:hypothetical protein
MRPTGRTLAMSDLACLTGKSQIQSARCLEDQIYLILQIPNQHFLSNVCLVHSLISINRLLESVLLCPKVIPLSDAHCIYNFLKESIHRRSLHTCKVQLEGLIKNYCQIGISRISHFSLQRNLV